MESTCLAAILQTDDSIGNVFFLEEAATYWSYPYTLAVGERLRIEGQYPYARYMSFQIYDEQLAQRDGLADIDFGPDAGSVNPYRSNLSRAGQPRRYTAYVEVGAGPEEREPNVLYTQRREKASNLPGITGDLVYRVYNSHIDGSPEGGVPLPRVVIESSNGEERQVSPINCQNVDVPIPSTINDVLANLNGIAELEQFFPYPGTNPPTWHLYLGGSTITQLFTESEFIPPQVEETLVRESEPESQEEAAFRLANIHNKYLVAAVSRGWGQVLVINGIAPRYPDSRGVGPDARAKSAQEAVEQLRFWSFCQYTPILSQRYSACANDDEVPIDEHGRYTLVVSTPEQRPEKAREECGVAWIPWGASIDGAITFRHLEVDTNWEHSAHRIEKSGQEFEVMREYLPRMEYLSGPAAFDQRNCAQDASDDQDGDHIPDNMDQCPNTPRDEVAKSDGCSRSQVDSDNDGVSDDEDFCPDSSSGEAVDRNGCAGSDTTEEDSSQDGLPFLSGE